MNIKDLIYNTDTLHYKELCSALIERFGVKQAVKWDSVLPHEQQQTLFGGEILRLVSDHPTLANHKEIRPLCLMKGELSQLLFFYVQLKDEKLPKTAIERLTRKFIGGTAAERYVIWFLGNKNADVFKIVISGKEGKKVKQKTLTLEAGQWFKTYDYILSEVERKFSANGLFQEFKEPSGLWKAVWEAFDISIVNKKFYAEIKEVFDALTKEYLPKCKGVLTNDQDRVQFAIRLIGRIIFCWFLKRKSIVADDVMSSRAVQTQQNYYRDLLEPLFFDVFNTPQNERRKDLPALIKNYPFLNGGLFEPQSHDYKGNWALTIPNDWFMNFFRNTLERYNFTVDENTAASSEIAIDPEMLGRIFENLLAEQNPETGESARKATGSYYTPREIVDFMVEESLIAYLKTSYIPSPHPGEGKGEGEFDPFIEDFIHTGTLLDALKPHSKELLDKLSAIKVLDPACGSGAFPISMLQKLVGLKQQLDPKTSPYDLKLKTIENSIYGVDIQPMATELSRLRCWLSLIVDEDPKNIKPLPNLDFKFVTANSLIDLGYDEFLHKFQTGKIESLFLMNFKKDLDALKAVRQQYFESSLHQREKDKLKKEFNTISSELFKMSLELIKQRLLDTDFANRIIGWDPFDDSKPAPFFNKSWMFGIEDGFDVVMGNPPYVSIANLPKETNDVLSKQNYETYSKGADIYCLFYEKGLNLSRTNGILSYISSNRFCFTNYGVGLRRYLSQKNILELINFNEINVFESANVGSIVTFIQNNKSSDKQIVVNEVKGELNPFIISSGCKKIDRSFYRENQWSFDENSSQSLKQKIENKGVPFHKWRGITINRGITTGANNIFIIDEFKRNELIKEDSKSKDILVPVLRGANIKRYSISKPDQYLVFTSTGIRIQDYPAVYKYLTKHRAELEEVYEAKHGQKKWYELRKCTYYDNFSMKKLVWTRLSNQNAFSISVNGEFTVDSSSFAVGDDIEYLSAVLNSKIVLFYFKLGSVIWGKDGIKWFGKYFDNIPIPDVPPEKKKPIVLLVNQIFTAKKKDPNADTSALETEIDRLVYALYNLTPEEIAIVEGRK
jgi:adenine-specific DNA-methyltransferase